MNKCTHFLVICQALKGYLDAKNELTVMFHTLTMNFKDQNGDLVGTGNERVYIDNVGYKADGETVAVPLGSTVYYKAYFKEGSGLYGPKNTIGADGAFTDLMVTFRSLNFDIIDSVTKTLIDGAQVYVDNVGYVNNGDSIGVPFGGTIQHKAKVGSTWSAVSSKSIDSSWSKCTYEWNGTTFSNPSYD